MAIWHVSGPGSGESSRCRRKRRAPGPSIGRPSNRHQVTRSAASISTYSRAWPRRTKCIEPSPGDRLEFGMRIEEIGAIVRDLEQPLPFSGREPCNGEWAHQPKFR